MDHDDTDLFPGWQSGDPAAFTALVRRWQQPIARFLFHFVGNNEQVQDLTQDVFLRAFLAASRYREQGELSAWLYRIALNVARDNARRTRPSVKPVLDVPGTDLSPGERYEQKETSAMVSRAIYELPEPLRVVLILRHYEHMSYEQIARMLRAPASTLKSRFAAALERLRECLQTLAPDNEESKK
jgi:RNA polymerase sigma-70 factor (ECF subfamily)